MEPPPEEDWAKRGHRMLNWLRALPLSGNKAEWAAVVVALVMAFCSNDLTKRAMRVGSRPWILHTVGLQGNAGVVVKGTFPEPTTATIELKNFGAGPALDLRVSSRLTLLPSGIAGPFEGATLGTPFNNTVVAPGAVFTATANLNLSTTELAQLQTGAVVLWFVGAVEYNDAFGEHHSTRFCFYGHPSIRDKYFVGEGCNAAD